MEKVIIVTGGASGIGRETAYLLAEEGAKVVVADINLDAAKDVVKKIKDKNQEAVAFKVDTSDRKNIQEMVDFAVELMEP